MNLNSILTFLSPPSSTQVTHHKISVFFSSNISFFLMRLSLYRTINSGPCIMQLKNFHYISSTPLYPNDLSVKLILLSVRSKFVQFYIGLTTLDCMIYRLSLDLLSIQ